MVSWNTHFYGKKACLSDRVYIRGMIEKESIMLIADTGTSKTVVSSRYYNKLNPHKRPTLQNQTFLKDHEGAPLSELGKGLFNLKMGSLGLEQEVIVADIEYDCLPG